MLKKWYYHIQDCPRFSGVIAITKMVIMILLGIFIASFFTVNDNCIKMTMSFNLSIETDHGFNLSLTGEYPESDFMDISKINNIPTPTPTPMFPQSKNVPAEYGDMCNEVKSILGTNAELQIRIITPTPTIDGKVIGSEQYVVDFEIDDVEGGFLSKGLEDIKKNMHMFKKEIKYYIDKEFSDEKELKFTNKKIIYVAQEKMADVEVNLFKKDGYYSFSISNAGGDAICYFDQKGKSTKLAEKIMLSFIQK